MAQILSVSINLSKIDKTKIISGKNGTKYLNLQIIVNDEKDKYENDIAVAQGQTKEERDRKDKKNYLGNGRIVWTGKSKNQNNDLPPSMSDNDLPF